MQSNRALQRCATEMNFMDMPSFYASSAAVGAVRGSGAGISGHHKKIMKNV